jgi:hypothetical protein
MPVFNLFKNCSYYYGFAAYVAYFANHPDYTSPPEGQSLALFAVATLFQLANLRWGARGRVGGLPAGWPAGLGVRTGEPAAVRAAVLLS